MRAFLEQIDGEWLDDFVYITKYKLKDLGYTIIPFDGDDMNKTLLGKYPTKDDVIIGSVQATEVFFKAIGVEIPKYLGYPESLKKYLGREIIKTTIGNIDKSFPYFIKPAEEVKLFTGDIIENEKSLITLKTYFGDGINDNTNVYVSDKIDIESEYRCFVHEGKLKGIQYYAGDFRIYPESSKIEEMVKCFDNSPVAYTLDVGVTNNGETILVEINDMWAIGSYGFDFKDYTLMCVRRLKEIIND